MRHVKGCCCCITHLCLAKIEKIIQANVVTLENSEHKRIYQAKGRLNTMYYAAVMRSSY